MRLIFADMLPSVRGMIGLRQVDGMPHEPRSGDRIRCYSADVIGNGPLGVLDHQFVAQAATGRGRIDVARRIGGAGGGSDPGSKGGGTVLAVVALALAAGERRPLAVRSVLAPPPLLAASPTLAGRRASAIEAPKPPKLVSPPAECGSPHEQLMTQMTVSSIPTGRCASSRTVFNLDSSQTDFHRVLENLSQRFTLEQIEEMFDGEMSAQARAYVIGQQRRHA